MKTQIIYDPSTALKSLDNSIQFLEDQEFKGSLENIIISDFQINILEGGRPGAWEPLSAVTLERRRKRKNNPNQSVDILRDTNRMFSSIHSVDQGKKGFFITTNVGYDADQHFGTDKIPARPFFVLSPGALQEIDSLGKKHESDIIK